MEGGEGEGARACAYEREVDEKRMGGEKGDGVRGRVVVGLCEGSSLPPSLLSLTCVEEGCVILSVVLRGCVSHLDLGRGAEGAVAGGLQVVPLLQLGGGAHQGAEVGAQVPPQQGLLGRDV